MATQTEVLSELKELISRPGVHRNLLEGALVEHAIRRDEGRLASNGAIVAYTGKHTGRSPQDKFTVKDSITAEKVAWGNVNLPFDADKFDALFDRVVGYLRQRELFVQEYPPVVMLNPGQITAPPLEAMQPIVSLTPADRRKAFFILFADNLRTLDGNAAFLYGVNLVVAFKDLGAFQQIYREALAYHERLYAPLHAVAKAMTT